ncbi:hypothetical protein [Shewanella sp. Choline-02u-19]|uniref:hypothetical protein n=1 Tax=Shewanella sp. Choline-02u-19 TaxID=2058309 RepID=UPI001E5F8A6D|nr:hypothetical protein [Shewanella sp. Choline-02u-19]
MPSPPVKPTTSWSLSPMSSVHSAPQIVTVTVTGTNDIPLITSTIADATGEVLEAGVMDGGNDPENGSSPRAAP